MELKGLVSVWPGVFSAVSPWWLCLTCDVVWWLPPSPSPPATGPDSGTVGPSASVWSVWSLVGPESPVGESGRPPTLSERCPGLCLQFEVYPKGLLSLCWSRQRKAETGHLSSVPAAAMRKIKKDENRNSVSEEFKQICCRKAKYPRPLKN